jgi:methylmalonyl-CoA/ethylmalonyl-CoA epimerase
MSEKQQEQVSATATANTRRFHHTGYVVKSIAEIGRDFARSIGANWSGEIIHDPLQEARVSFFRCGGPETPAIELVEPAGEKSPLHNSVVKGGGLHHVCYEVDRLEAQLEESRAAGCVLVKQPLPAVAFGGRRIAWVFTRHKLLIEYLER